MVKGKAVVVGASSGIGREIARRLIDDGWTVGVAARRVALLEPLRALAPERVTAAFVDVTADDAPAALDALADAIGGMDLYVHVAGAGKRNATLCGATETATVDVNAAGFCRMTGQAYRYFAERGRGHIAVISSIAGTRGLGAAPAYSATKAFQCTYIEALSQLARMRKLNITFTDIRPGFVDTALIAGDNYPMTMDVRRVADRAVSAIYGKKEVTVIDWRWSILTFFWKLVPHVLWRRMRIG